MPDLRLGIAVSASKGLTRGIRLAGRGGGTAFPGLVATRIDPCLLDKLAARLPSGAIVVAGTNGKTTTTRMISEMLTRQGLRVVHNRSGSNLVRGISAAFAEQMGLTGSDGDIAVIEADENAFPEVVRRTQPRLILLLNLFRDQLDRYGELETIAASWRPVVEQLDPETILVVNADDPNLAALAANTPATVVTFGLEIQGYDLPELPHAADAAICRVCESRLGYDAIYLSHLGAFRCPTCGNRRPDLDFSIRTLSLEHAPMQHFALLQHETGDLQEYQLTVPGLYNIYNALAAITTARTLGVTTRPINETLATFQPAFGRLEQISYHGLEMTLALAKNPVGFNEIIRMLGSNNLADTIVIAINDLDADGRDVSWLWDVDFEILADSLDAMIITAGIRGLDMAVRMKYAGLDRDRLDTSVADRPFKDVLKYLSNRLPAGNRIFILLTYTAMLQMRAALSEQGAAVDFWEQ